MRFSYLMTNCCQYFAQSLKYNGKRSAHFTATSLLRWRSELLEGIALFSLNSPLQLSGIVQLHLCTIHDSLMLETFCRTSKEKVISATKEACRAKFPPWFARMRSDKRKILQICSMHKLGKIFHYKIHNNFQNHLAIPRKLRIFSLGLKEASVLSSFDQYL